MASSRTTLAVLSLGALLLAACETENPMAEIPSETFEAPAAAFATAVDSGRAAVRAHVAARSLPGVSVAVGRNDEIVWAEGFGWADLSKQTPVTPQTLYPVGSISKPLTSTAAGVLHDRGMLEFDVPIQDYLPEFPEKKWTITPRMLMGHVAGVLRNRSSQELLRQGHCDDARSAIVPILEDTLIFEPTTEWRYSNHGFRIVGAMVESVAGEPYLDFMKREVFQKAGMDSTVPDLGDEGPHEATKYDRGDFSTLRQAQVMDMSCSMAPGGFLSTPTELVRFGFAMLNDEIIDPATKELFWTSQRLVDGERTGYGFGWQVGDVSLGDDQGRTPRVGHGGSVLGGRASLMIFPEEEMVVATMTNASDNISSLTTRVAAFFRDPG